MKESHCKLLAEQKKRYPIFNLRLTVLIIFILFFVGAMILSLLTSFHIFSRILTYTSIQLMNSTSHSIVTGVNEGLSAAVSECEFTKDLIKKGILRTDENHMVPYTFYLAKTLPYVYTAFWGNENGEEILAQKELDGSITTAVIHNDVMPPFEIRYFRDPQGNIIKTEKITTRVPDLRNNAWYKLAKEKKQKIWSNIYLLSSFPSRLGITTFIPILDQEKMSGAIGVAITLDYLNTFISAQKLTTNGFSFIITDQEDLVAFPDQQSPFNQIIKRPLKLLNVHKVGLPLIDSSFQENLNTGKETLSLTYQNKNYLISYAAVPELISHRWSVGTVVPRNDFIGPLLNVYKISLVVIFIILFIGIILFSKLVSHILKPIKFLVHETEKIKNFNLKEKGYLHSKIKEINNLQEAIVTMKKGLRYFQKYVPRVLVKQLILSGEITHLSGERKPLVVFFSDIRNFSKVSSEIDPMALTLLLKDYFEASSNLILTNQGTIDKYIEANVMAFWGAPISQDYSCHKAAKAALSIKATLKKMNRKWQKQGMPPLPISISIHKGEAIVGNLGSSWRLSYTAIGDVVNTTSRIQKLNKIYHTQIIVSESVYKVIKDDFKLRLLDSITVRGKKIAFNIYELLGDLNFPLNFDLTLYNQIFSEALQAFKEKKFLQAAKLFYNCLTIYPDDQIAPIFIARCENQ